MSMFGYGHTFVELTISSFGAFEYTVSQNCTTKECLATIAAQHVIMISSPKIIRFIN